MSDIEYPKVTAFDQIVAPEQVQVMKAIIPYAPPQGQRLLSVYAKAMELRNTLSMFQSQNSDMSVCSVPDAVRSPVDMLNDIREHCPAPTRSKIDEFMNMFAMIQMIEIFQSSDEE